MTIEPLRNLPVIRDLVVDRSPFERKVASLEPWIERTAPYAGFPEPLLHKEMENASKALDCIGCMACYSACPVIGLGDLTDFAGPAPLVQLAQAALDPRDTRERAADLIVLGMPFRRRLGRTYVGKTVQNVYLGAHCAVLAYRQEEVT
jgi:succinate dehydrogenase/fumarate reductase iron-sulfur protein